MTTIPEDVAALIRQAARAEPAGMVGEAGRLCTKYGINAGPETLADCGGAITYERVYWAPEGQHQTIEADQPRGIRFWLNEHPTPWPDDGGICQLLNDGWRLVPSSHLTYGTHELLGGGTKTPWSRVGGGQEPAAGINKVRNSPSHYVLAREVQP